MAQDAILTFCLRSFSINEKSCWSYRLFQFNFCNWIPIGFNCFFTITAKNIKTTERYLHVSKKDLVNIVSPLDDLWRKGKVDW